MIVVDIETSGLYPEKHGIWQIGALYFYNPKNTFLEEARIDEEDQVAHGALAIIGKTERYLRNPEKQSQKQLLRNLFTWAKTIPIKSCLCQNPNFDLSFISYKARKYDLKIPFHYRSFDLHSLAQLKYCQIHGNFLIKEERSDMGLSAILKFCGMDDKRIKMENEKVEKKGTPHNALEDAKLTAECFSRLIYGKPVFDEYSEFKIPEYLIK